MLVRVVEDFLVLRGEDWLVAAFGFVFCCFVTDGVVFSAVDSGFVLACFLFLAEDFASVSVFGDFAVDVVCFRPVVSDLDTAFFAALEFGALRFVFAGADFVDVWFVAVVLAGAFREVRLLLLFEFSVLFAAREVAVSFFLVC